MSEYPYDVAITAGVFDLWHEGHQELADFMARLAPINVAFVHDDNSTIINKSRIPVHPLEVRMLNAARFGRYLVYPVFDADPSALLRESFQRTFRGLRVCFSRGDDSWPGGKFPGEECLEDANVPIILKPYMPGVSSSRLRSNLS